MCTSVLEQNYLGGLSKNSRGTIVPQYLTHPLNKLQIPSAKKQYGSDSQDGRTVGFSAFPFATDEAIAVVHIHPSNMDLEGDNPSQGPDFVAGDPNAVVDGTAATRRSTRPPKPSIKRLASQFEEDNRLADEEECEERRARGRR